MENISINGKIAFLSALLQNSNGNGTAGENCYKSQLKIQTLWLTSQTRYIDEALFVFDDNEPKHITKYPRYGQRVCILWDNIWTELDDIGTELTTMTRLKVPDPLFHL